MTTPEEKVVQLERALQGRFFKYVLQRQGSGYANWTEDQHTIDRCSRALAAYAIAKQCDLDDVTAVGAITDGSEDGGIDALYFDRNQQQLVFVQAKYKRSGTSPSQEEVLKTLNGIRRLRDRQFNNFNAAVQNQLAAVEEAFDTPGIRIIIIIVFPGVNFNLHAQGDLDSFRNELDHTVEIITINRLYDWLISEQTPPNVTVTLTVESYGHVTTPYRAYYGQVSASVLASLAAQHGTSLFERNIRHYLGQGSVNTAIQETAISHPQDLFYLNNGITAVAKTITNSLGRPSTFEKSQDRPSSVVLTLQNFSIVNGAQTVGAIRAANESSSIAPEAKVFITIIELAEQGDELGKQITHARNHQNRVREVDFAALDPQQERLRRELSVMDIDYYYRPSAQAHVRRDDMLTLEEAALAIACLHFTPRSSTSQQNQNNAIPLIATAKAEIGQLWNQQGTIYRQLFSPKLTGLRMYRFTLIYRFIDSILAATERAENEYLRRTFFRHARYFIMAFVAGRSQEVLRPSQMSLNDADQAILSRTTNQLSELIYDSLQDLRFNKGCLAIFRNQTDSQQLADEVLHRLSVLDKSSTPPIRSN